VCPLQQTEYNMTGDTTEKGDTEVEGEHSPPENPEQGPMDTTDTQGQGLEVEVKEQDRWLPIANVARIMKSALPENAKIAKEAKECMQECVSEFISFITSEASEKCQQEKRKTVNGEDILFAMTSLGFENYSEALKIYLARYRETLLASQKSAGTAVAGGTGAGAGNANANAGANASAAAAYAEPSNDAILNEGLDTSDHDPSAFGYGVGVHNGNGAAEY
jgi:nuclear transcription Y subunit beta